MRAIGQSAPDPGSVDFPLRSDLWRLGRRVGTVTDSKRQGWIGRAPLRASRLLPANDTSAPALTPPVTKPTTRIRQTEPDRTGHVWLGVTSGPFGVPSLKPARARRCDNASDRAAGSAPVLRRPQIAFSAFPAVDFRLERRGASV